MKTCERIIEVNNPEKFKWDNIYNLILKKAKDIKPQSIVKLNLVKSSKSKLYFHIVYIEDFKGAINEPFKPCTEADFKHITKKSNEISCLIIPTGVGARFGGYAGDANPLAKLFSNTSKYFLTHPNVVNGAVLSDIPNNLIYLEGFLLDQFLLGKINLIPTNQNKIGVIFDKGISEKRLDYEINVLNALKIFYGCEIKAWTITEKSLNIIPSVSKYGFSSGKIKNLDEIIKSAFKLKKIGVTAIAICCAIPDLNLNKNYISGKGIDPIGGIESIISHVVSAKTSLVSAHAPVLLSSEKVNYKKISLLSASEYVAQTFLPSVISGLRFAPQIVGAGLDLPNKTKSFQDIRNIIVPYNAFGSAGVLFQNEQFKNVILIKENKTCLDVSPNHLNIKFKIIDGYRDLVNRKKIAELGINSSVLKRPVFNIPEI